MAWQTPKTDWSAADGVRNSDLNRIEENILELYRTGSAHTNQTIYVATTGSDATGDGTSAAPYRTIQYAISKLPRNSGGYAVGLNIASGTYAEYVQFSGFAGTIEITGSYDATISIDGLAIDGCNVRVSSAKLSVGIYGILMTGGATFYSDAQVMVSGAATGFRVDQNSLCAIYALVTISSTSVDAVRALYNGRFYALAVSGSSNSTAFSAEAGGVIAYGSSSIVAIAMYYTTDGGRIYTGAQASIPNY